jgi:hypothetical protein
LYFFHFSSVLFLETGGKAAHKILVKLTSALRPEHLPPTPYFRLKDVGDVVDGVVVHVGDVVDQLRTLIHLRGLLLWMLKKVNRSLGHGKL